MKKAWTKLLVACMAAMLAVGVCFAFTACDEGEVPTSTKYTYDSVSEESFAELYDQMYAGSTAYFENGKFVWEELGAKMVMDYTEEEGVYHISYGDELEDVLGVGTELNVTFDDTTLTIAMVTTVSSSTVTVNILFKA